MSGERIEPCRKCGSKPSRIGFTLYCFPCLNKEPYVHEVESDLERSARHQRMEREMIDRWNESNKPTGEE